MQPGNLIQFDQITYTTKQREKQAQRYRQSEVGRVSMFWRNVEQSSVKRSYQDKLVEIQLQGPPVLLLNEVT